jgi:hypothetical protein
LTIEFPQSSDILKKKNSAIESELKKFLSFHTYTNPTAKFTASAVSTATIDYEFVSRLSTGNIITIRLASVPNQTHFVAKFDQDFTYGNGQKVNLANYPGYIINGDFYKQISTEGYIGESDPPSSPAADFIAPGHQNWYIDIRNAYDSETANFLTTDQEIRRVLERGFYLSYGTDTGTTYLEAEAEYKKLCEEIMGKIELQKWDNKVSNPGWVTVPSAIKYLDDTTNPLEDDGDGLYAVYIKEDLTAYRAVIKGAKNLTTTDEYYGQKQRIAVRGYAQGGIGSHIAYDVDTVAGRPVFWYDNNENTRRIYTTIPSSLIANGRSEVSSDVNGTNVVLRIGFNSIGTFPSGTPVTRWLQEISTEVFKQNFKIVTRSGITKTLTGLGTTGNGIRAVNDLVFINIQKVEYRTSKDIVGTDIDEIVLTLDPSYVYQAGGTKYFIVAPGFKYADEKITLGDYSNWNFDIGGVKYWRWGGALPLNLQF